MLRGAGHENLASCLVVNAHSFVPAGATIYVRPLIDVVLKAGAGGSPGTDPAEAQSTALSCQSEGGGAPQWSNPWHPAQIDRHPAGPDPACGIPHEFRRFIKLGTKPCGTPARKPACPPCRVDDDPGGEPSGAGQHANLVL